MSKNRWFKFFPSDFIAGIRSLTPIEVTAYVVILCELYDHEGTCRRDDEHFSRACLIRKTDFSRALEGLVAKGKLSCEHGVLSNNRVVEEIEKRASAALTKAQRRHELDAATTRKQRGADDLYNKNNATNGNVRGYIDNRNKKEEITLEGSALHPMSQGREESLSPAVENFLKRREMLRRHGRAA